MNQTKHLAMLGTIALAFSGSVLAQTSGMAGDGASTASGTPTKEIGGTTMHKKNKALHLKGASAAAAASAMGTNDKGTPQ